MLSLREVKGTSEVSPCKHRGKAMWGHSEKAAWQARKRALTRNRSCQHLDHGPLASSTVRTSVCCSSPRLWHCVVVAQAGQDSLVANNLCSVIVVVVLGFMVCLIQYLLSTITVYLQRIVHRFMTVYEPCNSTFLLLPSWPSHCYGHTVYDYKCYKQHASLLLLLFKH